MFAIVSPQTAFLPCPTVNGPVGFAETNSTLAFLPLCLSDFPKVLGEARISFIISERKEDVKKKLIKPGPAISVFDIILLSIFKLEIIYSAISFGFFFNCFVSSIAAFEERSP